MKGCVGDEVAANPASQVVRFLPWGGLEPSLDDQGQGPPR